MEFYFSTMNADPIMIESSNTYSCPASTLPWIIAGSLVGAILLLGLLALIILKICLVFLVSFGSSVRIIIMILYSHFNFTIFLPGAQTTLYHTWIVKWIFKFDSVRQILAWLIKLQF